MNQEKQLKVQLQYKDSGKLIKYIDWYLKDRVHAWEYKIAIIIKPICEERILILNENRFLIIEKNEVFEIYKDENT